MKKIICLLSIILLLFSMSVPVFADTGATITATNVVAKKGDTISVPVKVINNNGLWGAVVEVVYDSTQLELTGVTEDCKDFFEYIVNTKENGLVRVLVNGKGFDDLKGDKGLFTLKFKVTDKAQQKVYVKVQCDDATVIKPTPSQTEITCFAGEVTVTDSTIAPTESMPTLPDGGEGSGSALKPPQSPNGTGIEEDGQGGDNLLIIISVIVLVLVIAGTITLIILKKKKVK